MTSDKKAITDPEEAMDTKESCSKDAECAKRASRKKRLLIAGLTLLAILACIAAAAVILLSFWTARIKVQEKEHLTIENKEVDQELYQDAVDSLTYYHIVDGTKQTWFILDNNRQIVVTKVKSEYSVSNCYVQPFQPNTANEHNTTSVPMTTTSSSQGNGVPSNGSLPVEILQPSNRPIIEKSMLGRRGQELCKDVDTFWILSSNLLGGSSRNDVRPRVRRAYTACYLDWNDCYYFSYADSPGRTYYGCRWKNC